MSPARRAQINDRDREVLEMLAEHRVVIVSQVQRLLGGVSPATAETRLRRLTEAGLIGYERIFEGHPAACWITRRGLGAIERRLPAPRVDLKGYRHDVGVAWLWLAAGEGCFGAVRERYSEREMRSSDQRGGGNGGEGGRDGRPFGVGLGTLGPRGGAQLHYPDLLVVTKSGHRVALELELTAKSRRRLDGIMLGFAFDPGIDSVVYLCPGAAIGRRVADAARRAGISDRVHVQRLAPGSPVGAPDPGRTGERPRGRAAGRLTGRAGDPGRSVQSRGPER